MSRELAVIIPSWSAQRAGALVWELTRRERRLRARYYIAGTAAAPSLHPDLRVISDWIPSEPDLSPVEAMAIGANRALADSNNSVLLFLHDDVEVDEPHTGWDTALLDHFATHPHCGLAGFGGALGLADPDIYKLPYDYRQLARHDFVSNMRDAHLHGRRVTEASRVAVLDGFSLICSREFYLKAGNRWITRHSAVGAPMLIDGEGRPLTEDGDGAWRACLGDGIPFHMYDAWISCRAAELGYETWMLPLAVHHQGGATSVGMADRYREVVKRLGYTSEQELYDLAHRRIYERFGRVLPLQVRRSSDATQAPMAQGSQAAASTRATREEG